MCSSIRPPLGRAARRVVTIALAGGVLVAVVGCQSYRPDPIDLRAHDRAVRDRLTDPAPLAAFATRMRDTGAKVPERLHLADGLTSAEAEVVALFHNADLRLARAEAGITRATAENAGRWSDPEFGFDGAEIISPSAPFEWGTLLRFTIPVSGRLAVERARAAADHEASLRRLVEAEWETRVEVRRAWARWVAAEEGGRLLDAMVEELGRIGEITDRLEAAGELPRVEARLFRVELAERRAEQAERRRAADRGRREVLGLLGLAPDAPVDLVEAFPVVDVSSSGDDTERLITASPDLAVRRAEHRAAEEAVRLEIRRQYPDLTLGAGYGREDDDRLLLGLSVPIPFLNANRGAIAEARARRDLTRAAAETTYERLARALDAARSDLDAVLRQRDRYETEILPMLAEQGAEVERLAGLGDVDILLLLETVTRRYQAKSRLLELRRAELAASIEIARLRGPRVVDPVPAPVTLPPTPESSPTAHAAPAAGGAS